jgi:hypothetical protein
MSFEPRNNSFLYFLVGILLAAVVVLSYLYFYKEGHSLPGREPQKPGINLRIDGDGIRGTVTPEEK